MPSNLQPKTFYVLDAQSAIVFDAKRPEKEKRFSSLLPGGNAYLLDAEDFEPLCYPDLDPGEPVRGCALPIEKTMSCEQRQILFAGLCALGYVVSPYPTHLLLAPLHRETVTQVADWDIQRVLGLRVQRDQSSAMRKWRLF